MLDEVGFTANTVFWDDVTLDVMYLCWIPRHAG